MQADGGWVCRVTIGETRCESWSLTRKGALAILRAMAVAP